MVRKMYALIKRLTYIIEGKSEVKKQEAAGVINIETEPNNHCKQQ